MDPQRFVRYLQIFGKLTVIWPPDSGANTRESLLTKWMWNVLVIFNLLSIYSMTKKALQLADDPVALAKLISQISIIADSLLHLILVTAQWPRLQILTREVIDFVKTAKTNENTICRKYVKRYLVWHIFLASLYFATIIAFWSSPLTQKSLFPVDTWYSFSINVIPNRIFVYIVQYVVILEALWILSGNFMIIMLIWYASVQFELLGLAMRDVDSMAGIRKCVERHKRIMSFVTETKSAMRLIVLKSLAAASVAILSAGLQLVHNRTLTVLSQFLLIVCVASLTLFGWAWTGDDLTEMAAKLSWSIYQSPAIEGSLSLRKCVLIIMQRTRKSSSIALWGRSFRVSLEFFTVYVIRVVSFFMTLRAVVDRWV